MMSQPCYWCHLVVQNEPEPLQDDEERKNAGIFFSCIASLLAFIVKGPSADWSAAPEQLLQHIIQVVLAVVPDCERIAVVSASDHGRQSWAHIQEVVRGGRREMQQVDRK